MDLAKGYVCSLCVVEQTKGDRYHSFVVEFVFYSEGVVRILVVCTKGSVGGLSRDIVFPVVFGFESVVRILVVCTKGNVGGSSRDIVFLVVFGFESGCRSYIGGRVFVPSGERMVVRLVKVWNSVPLAIVWGRWSVVVYVWKVKGWVLVMNVIKFLFVMAYLKSFFLPYNCIIYTFSHLAKAIRAMMMGMLERLHVNRRARTNHPPTQQNFNTTRHTHAVLAFARTHENTRTHIITQPRVHTGSLHQADL